MQSRSAINLVMLATLAGLAAVAWFRPGIESPPEVRAITSLGEEELVRVQLQRPVREDLLLYREDAAAPWKIDHDPVWPAGGFQIRALLKLASEIPVRSYDAQEMDLEKLGLQSPRASVTFNQTRIDFGDQEPLENLRFVKVNGDIHLIPDSHMQLIEAPASQFVQRRVLPDGISIDTMVLPGLKLSRREHQWTLEPEQALSSDDIEQFITRWKQAEAVYIKLADPPVDENYPAIVIENAVDGQPLQLVIAEREPDLVLIRPDFGLAYHMGNRSSELLSPAGNAHTGNGR